ncbi:MAG: hypothetical protein HW377_1812 [Actinobacteria bacterium]|nr:hypothetical protein [Actinomycetota bacterium]
MLKGSIACYKCSHEVMKRSMFRQSHNARTRIDDWRVERRSVDRIKVG